MVPTTLPFIFLLVGVSSYGGPPLLSEYLPSHGELEVTMPLPGQEVLSIPPTILVGLFQRPDQPEKDKPAEHYVTLDDLDRVDSAPHPPLQFAIPVHFRDDGSAQDVPDLTRGITDWLPHSVQSLLPTLPTLPTLPSLSSFIPSLPSFIPGFNLEAEVHRKPLQIPHIPTPNELLQRVNHAVESAFQRLHTKQQQLVELVRCSCPRPARCDALFQEFMSLGSRPPVVPTAPTEPGLSLYAELTKPNGGHGPGFGFFVDQKGPHLGHHVHSVAAASASVTASSPT